jgi:excisionase family DNA binding protein
VNTGNGLPVGEFVTPGQLARALGFKSKRVIYAMIESGELPAYRPRWEYRIRREDAEAAIERARGVR